MGTYMCQGAPTFMNTWECTIINTHICTHIQKIVYSNGDVSLATSTKGQFQRYPGLFYLLLPETSSYHKKQDLRAQSGVGAIRSYLESLLCPGDMASEWLRTAGGHQSIWPHSHSQHYSGPSILQLYLLCHKNTFTHSIGIPFWSGIFTEAKIYLTTHFAFIIYIWQ